MTHLKRYDFVTGTAIQKRLIAVLDYRRQSFTFKADGSHFRMNLAVGCGGTVHSGIENLGLAQLATKPPP